ncbi:GDP-mannose 4,6-dehydratase [Campylobacter vulpis]|uniref:NAD-dependent epimerase/dehydratase family protein n=1 Tax=Campylobacter vulpis TaxID=1655500 RepID=A0ABS5P2K3_9BACT|nr:GDP-mannose 4,6-dehydratase [Campylobacter vulpis]MBS4235645.1 NAD-dependent epimerase/dehydratase family protein [Campylobacter vulpis]MBS4240927.1 NAD-dependent epimerase/dehydratase family protein [Campylobacter vulpis]MBS4269793.1 NAD-dependent epimerase/dehydratase family protein [Campylobacter vulpis]MBS4313663.1 NAD-dependent epimerase/dehydratase family protein [Campylobacter vulpis]MBS4330297.1 NAD-dependent epimerase/dehydratase family protein [Campylobacter vulpis]
MKKILITGADGFIGSHLCEVLHAKGYAIRALSFYNSFNFWGHLEHLECREDLEIVSGDLRDSFFCDSLVKGVDAVLHLGALIAIPYSYAAPQSYVDTNIQGTLNLLEAAKKHAIKRFIHTSTSEVYGSAIYTPIDEKHPLQPQSPYSASKIGADMLALSYFYSFNLPIIVARPFNAYGPRQSARAFIPAMMVQILSGARELKVGDLSTKRDLNFVRDTCEGFATLLTNGDFGEVYNIGSGVEYTMSEVLELICELSEVEVKIAQDKTRLRPKNSEVTRLLCDSSKLKSVSAWESKVSLKEGLEQTLAYVKANLNAYKTGIYNV